MDKFIVGDKVITRKGFLSNGDNLENRLGIVIDTSSYILVEIDDYRYNPVKCFRNEVVSIEETEEEDEDLQQLQFDWMG